MLIISRSYQWPYFHLSLIIHLPLYSRLSLQVQIEPTSLEGDTVIGTLTMGKGVYLQSLVLAKVNIITPFESAEDAELNGIIFITICLSETRPTRTCRYTVITLSKPQATSHPKTILGSMKMGMKIVHHTGSPTPYE